MALTAAKSGYSDSANGMVQFDIQSNKIADIVSRSFNDTLDKH